MSRMSAGARLWAAVAAALAVALGTTMALTFTGAFDEAPAAEGGSAGAESVEVRLTEFSIDPGEITVPAGTPLEFAVSNEGAAAHDFQVEGVAATSVLDPGDAETLAVDALEPGEYRLVCMEPGHEGAGMVGTLVVSDDEGAGDGDHGDGAHEDGAAELVSSGQMSAEEMAAKHDDLSAFPADTEGRGNQPLAPEVADDGTKVFDLTAEEIEWEVAPGDVRDAVGFNGQVPGPRIDVDLGDRVRIVLRNEMSMPTALHLHGLVLPNDMDGVPGLTQDSVMPGEEFAYEFEVRNSGSHMYHSHFDSAKQVPSGLLGAFIVHGDDEPEVDRDIVMVLNDGPLGYTLNGKGFPATEPVQVKRGETVRIRYMNEGLQIHPMHLHGMPQRVIAKDGYPLEVPRTEDNVLVSPGDRVDVIVEATEPGAWAWHCHILTHAEGEEGMFGMVSAVIVEE